MSVEVELASSTPSSEALDAAVKFDSLSSASDHACLRQLENRTKNKKKNRRRTWSNTQCWDVHASTEWRREKNGSSKVGGDLDATPITAIQRESLLINIRQSWLGMGATSETDGGAGDHQVLSLSVESLKKEALKSDSEKSSDCSATEVGSGSSDEDHSSSSEDPITDDDDEYDIDSSEEGKLSQPAAAAGEPFPDDDDDYDIDSSEEGRSSTPGAAGTQQRLSSDESSVGSTETPATDTFIQELMSMDDDICSLSCCLFGCRCDVEGYKCLGACEEDDHNVDSQSQKVDSSSKQTKEMLKARSDNENEKDEEEDKESMKESKAPKQTPEKRVESNITDEEPNRSKDIHNVATMDATPVAREEQQCEETKKVEDHRRRRPVAEQLEGQDIIVRSDVSFCESLSKHSQGDFGETIDEESFGEFQCWTETKESNAGNEEVAGKLDDTTNEMKIPVVIATNKSSDEDNPASVYSQSLDSLVIAFKQKASVWDEDDDCSVHSALTTPASWIPVWDDINDEVPRSQEEDSSVRTSTSAPCCLTGSSHYAERARLRTEEEILTGALQAVMVAKEIEKAKARRAKRRRPILKLFSRRYRTNRTGKEANHTNKFREKRTSRLESTTFGRNIKFLKSLVTKGGRG